VSPDWLHDTQLAMPSEHVAHSVDGPHVALGPGSVMHLDAVQAEQPGLSLV